MTESPPEKIPAQFVEVSPAEAGQKLTNFLQRRIPGKLPQSVMLKWIRTGQVRVDKGRVKPFMRVKQGQTVRIPPYIPAQTQDNPPASAATTVDVVQQYGDIWVVRKPAGLPVQPGSGHNDALSERLKEQYRHLPFTPTPAHRLDRDTTGIVLVGASYTALQQLHNHFRDHAGGKHYLAWVHGCWEQTTPLTMQDQLEKSGDSGREKIHTSASGKPALAVVTCLSHGTAPTGQPVSLLQIELFTGRTHQIRVQLASRGFPIVGDNKYGPSKETIPLKLHAWKLILDDATIFELEPDWTGMWNAAPTVQYSSSSTAGPEQTT